MPDFNAGDEQAVQAPVQPAADQGGTLPSPTEYDTADVSDYGESDSEAMNILLAAGQDEDEPATPAVEAAAPEAPTEADPVFFTSEYDDISDDEIAARAAGMTPAQLRAAFGNGKAMNRGLNEKMRANAERERALSQQQQQLAHQQQQLLETYRSLQAPTPAAPAAPVEAELDFGDILDPLSGEIDPSKFRAAIRREAEAIADAKIAPITAAETQRQQQAQQVESARVVGEINTALGHMRGAFPHFKPEVEQAVIDRMVATNNPDPMAVYASMYRKEYADTIFAFEQKKRAAAAKHPPPSAPATPPGVRGQAAPVAPMGMAETNDAMAKEIARLTGTPLRQLEQ
ncbi:MAG: hypothetical protein ACYC63_19885 [Armatimonadota bacterium]